ncbi:unnamed protein product [Rotaria sp. Silwood1]|nr:unnamed protein product [Rotaria sp. Silwood1]CAF3806580.1 unnamed protein product [Rotaria sp. Silwood1]CAF3884179.1 unnamed protein product [Rotaria sp. Silwood1]CAF4849465.1 unnamed protein product [Rotaria sp. Silwood1]CAF4889330.1 unnamed protein product [Rotaria sp. Silwood1]
MDLIDMRNRPDHGDSGKIFKWIIQLKDHFTKSCWAQPLETKEAKDVYSTVRNIFFNFGPPHILQSDNGLVGQDPRSDCHHWQATHQASLSGPVEIDDLQIESFTTETNLYNPKPSQSRSLLVKFSPSKKSTKRSKLNIDIYSSCTKKRNISSTNVPSSSQTFGPLVTIDESRHDIIRESGRINYLKSQSKRQKIYDEYLNVMANSYSKGDLIGIPVDKVD